MSFITELYSTTNGDPFYTSKFGTPVEARSFGDDSLVVFGGAEIRENLVIVGDLAVVGTITASSISATPAGAPNQIQYCANDGLANVFGASSSFTFDNATKQFAVTGGSINVLGEPSGGLLANLTTGPSASSVYNPVFQIYQSRVSTGTNVLTTLFTLATATGTTYMVEARVQGQGPLTGDIGGFVVSAAFKNVAGTISVKGGNKMVLYRDDDSWDVDVSGSGSSLNVVVTGAAASTVNWQCTVFVQKYGVVTP